MNADAEAIIEQALRFALDEQAKLLTRPDVGDLTQALICAAILPTQLPAHLEIK